MNHRDYVILQKISSELNIAKIMLGDETLGQFEEDEKTKRAICMTAINIGELVKNITEPTRLKMKFWAARLEKKRGCRRTPSRFFTSPFCMVDNYQNQLRVTSSL